MSFKFSRRTKAMNIPANCDRCHKSISQASISKFNSDIICSNCNDKEINHPKYQEATKINQEVKSSNFRGIGKPQDL